MLETFNSVLIYIFTELDKDRKMHLLDTGEKPPIAKNVGLMCELFVIAKCLTITVWNFEAHYKRS